MKCVIDILEDRLPKEILTELLKDHTTEKNIFWASSDYSELGLGFEVNDFIETHSVTGSYGQVIMPRILKTKAQKKKRTIEKAEIFTPAWVCNDMCNAGDERYRAKDSNFNKTDYVDGKHVWCACSEPIRFAEGVTWQDYILRNCLEITCGEAPYLVSRYDTTSGELIPLSQRIGLLDRKIRIVNENVSNLCDWLEWTLKSFQTTYGYDWQGDNVLLARENLFYSFIEYYEERWGEFPSIDKQIEVAKIISWNIFQMDGLKMVIPNSCRHGVIDKDDSDLFNEEKMVICEGCKTNNPSKHNGIPVKIMDWEKHETIEFRSLYAKKQ